MVEVKRIPAPSGSRLLTIGEVAERAGVATSALRFYEDNGLITSERNEAGHRRFRGDVLRRIAFIRVAQRVGLSLGEIRATLATLPAARTPTVRDWNRLAERWKPLLLERMALLERTLDQLDSCIGCGCLSLEACGLYNLDDAAAALGSGPRYLYSDDRPDSS